MQSHILYKPDGRKLITDIDLHFDAQRLMFSMPGTHDRWNVFEINTDGIVNAENFEQEQFGKERLVESISRYANQSASRMAQNIIWDVRRFVGLADQADDITLVAVKIQ